MLDLLIGHENASVQGLTPQAVVVTPRSSIRFGRRGVRRDCGFLGTRPPGAPRNGRSIVTAAMILLCLPALVSSQGSDVLSPAYGAVVGRYLSGDREGAVAEMVHWPEGRLRDETSALAALWRKAQACRPCAASRAWEQMPARAALMLHSDCAQRARRDGTPPRPQEAVAAEIARMLKDDPTHRAFARRWYEAMAGLAEGENRWGEALDWAERGLRDFPKSAEMLLVLGSIEETVGAPASFRVTDEALIDPDTQDDGEVYNTRGRSSCSTSRGPRAPREGPEGAALRGRGRPLAPGAAPPPRPLGLEARRDGRGPLGAGGRPRPQARCDGVSRAPVPRPARRGRRPARRRRACLRGCARAGPALPVGADRPQPPAPAARRRAARPRRRGDRRSAPRAAGRSRTPSGSTPGDRRSVSKTGWRRYAGRPPRERPRLALGAAASAQAPPPPTFTVDVEARLRRRLRDRRQPARRRGSPRPTSSCSDNGVRQPVELVAVESMPLTAFLVLDTSGSVDGEKLVQLQAAARALLGGLRPGDEAALVTFDQEIRVRVPPTAIARLERGVGGDPARRRHRPLRRALRRHDARLGPRPLPARGSSPTARTTSAGSTPAQVRRVLLESNVLVQAVGIVPQEERTPRPGLRSERPPPRRRTCRTLRNLAEVTGGRFWTAASPRKLAEAFLAILEAMKTRYVLRFEPDRAAGGGAPRARGEARPPQGQGPLPQGLLLRSPGTLKDAP